MNPLCSKRRAQAIARSLYESRRLDDRHDDRRARARLLENQLAAHKSAGLADNPLPCCPAKERHREHCDGRGVQQVPLALLFRLNEYRSRRFTDS